MNIPTTRSVTACIFAVFFALLSGCEKTDTQKAVVVDTQKAAAVGAQLASPKAETVDPNLPLKDKISNGARKQASAHNKQGLDYAVQKNYRKAIEEFRKAVELDSRNQEYLYHLGLSLSYQKDTMDEAVAVHLKAIAMKPGDMKFLVLNHYNLACTYALQGKTDKAFEHLEKLASLDSRTQFHLVQSDRDFDGMRNTPRFRQILEKIAKARSYDETGKPVEPGK